MPTVWRQFPEVHFVFIGTRTKFSQNAFRQILDHRVLELGKIDLQEKTDALAACDVFCMPSTQESFGGVYTEAWLLEKPVIGGNAPAIQEVISEGVDGYAGPQDANMIADKITRLLASPEMRLEMGKNGYEKVLTKYSWDILAEKTLDVYNTVSNAYKSQD